jgi:hypothetical protein
VDTVREIEESPPRADDPALCSATASL